MCGLRVRLFGSLYQNAKTSCSESSTGFNSCHRFVRTQSRPANQDGGYARVIPGWFERNHLPRPKNAAPAAALVLTPLDFRCRYRKRGRPPGHIRGSPVAGIAYGRPIAATNRARPQHGCLPLVRGEQHSRPQGRGAAGPYERDRARRTLSLLGNSTMLMPSYSPNAKKN